MSYLTFVLQERKLLSFGLSLTFFSSFGQTFLIALFVPYFLVSFDLSNAGFGAVYSVATLLSASALPWLGQWIDRIELRWYSLFVALGLLVASLIVMISWHIAILFVGIVLLRLSGQGLSGHTAQTSMARFYERERGKALSVSSLGFPIGEAVLPIVMAGLLTLFHWRAAWGIIALVIAFVLIPLLHVLIGRDSAGRSLPSRQDDTDDTLRANYTKIFQDRRIYYLIPVVLILPFWITGLFLYQIEFASEFGWTSGLIATAFMSFALFRILGSISIGPLIDRYSAQALIPFFLIPMMAGLTIPLFTTANSVAFAYMGFLGFSMGIGGNIKSALWAELFGTSLIGTVRSLFGAFAVFSTSLSPFLIGWLLDMGIPVIYIFVSAVLTALIASLLALRIHPRFNSDVSEP